MNLYDTLTQNSLNSIIYKMLNYMSILTPLNLFDDLENEYIKLDVDFGSNIITGDEVIVTDEFTVSCSDLVFSHLDYSLRLQYYLLESDIDGNKSNDLKELIVPLSSGDNTISFDDYPVYLQGDCELLIRKDSNVILPVSGVRLKLTGDKSTLYYDDTVHLSVTAKDTGEPLTDADLSFYGDGVLIDTVTTDSEGVAELDVNVTGVGDHLFTVTYGDYSSNGFNVKVLPRMVLNITGSSFSTTPDDNTFVYTGRVFVDWDDGPLVEYTGGKLTHTYSASDNYSVKIYGSITILGNDCFYGCTGLTSISISDSVTSLGTSCFERCTNLTSITISDSVTSLGDYCFAMCTGLTSIILEWDTSTEILSYKSSWVYATNPNLKLSIPPNTTSLYTAKGYPSDKLVERTQ